MTTLSALFQTILSALVLDEDRAFEIAYSLCDRAIDEGFASLVVDPEIDFDLMIHDLCIAARGDALVFTILFLETTGYATAFLASTSERVLAEINAQKDRPTIAKTSGLHAIAIRSFYTALTSERDRRDSCSEPSTGYLLAHGLI